VISEDDVAEWLDGQISDAAPLFHSYVRNGELVIESDRQGLLRFVRDLLSLTEHHHFPYMHKHFDAGNFSIADAKSLTVYRVEWTDWKGPEAGQA
jgi:hypothetical protein